MNLFTVPELIQRLESMDFCDADLSDAQVVHEASETLKRWHAALESVAFQRGRSKGFTHIWYCRWCGYSREWIAKHGHENVGECPLAQRSSSSGTAPTVTDGGQAEAGHLTEQRSDQS